MEDCWMAQAWERLLLAFLQKMVPAVSNISFPFEWVFHQSAIISLEHPQPGMVRKLAPLLWALPWFASARILLFVSVDSEAIRLSRAVWRYINVADVTNDIILDRGTDRVAIDATGCRLQRPEVTVSAESAALIARRWQEYGVA
jgi:4-hydroxy-3-polyprenylbenzoate decarboxylase